MSDSTPPEWLYIRVEVLPADPERCMLLTALAEKTTGRPTADIVLHTDPGGISFQHVRLVANDEEDAYTQGWHLLPPPAKGSVCNDYVVQI